MRSAILAVPLVLLLGACGHFEAMQEAVALDEQANTVMPQNYKPEIISFMRTYLNDPTQIRGALISDPVIKNIDGNRYIICLRYNAKKSNGQYAGNKDGIVTFRQGRLDRMIDGVRDPRENRQIREQCKDVALKPFPELEHITR